MKNQLHRGGGRAAQPPDWNFRRRAGLPAKRFFTRFAGLSHVPAEELEDLSGILRKALDGDPESPVPALQALVSREIRRRGMNHQR
ncbi:hypothetical protein ACU18_17710 [Arthrobacter sp. ZBG10]|nr:hypothetical protein ACU18_17710 [Arthrobacter sp. ZBG10]